MQTRAAPSAVLVQWIGPGNRSKPDANGDSVPREVARTFSKELGALVFLHEDTPASNSACAAIVASCKKDLPAAMIVEAVVEDVSDIDSVAHCRAALSSAARDAKAWAPFSRALSPITGRDAIAAIVAAVSGEAPAPRWVVSTATGTAATIVTLLAEVADALADAIDRRALASATVCVARWDTVEPRKGRPSLQTIESIDPSLDLLGRSRRARTRVLRDSPVGVPLLLIGPTGAGKTTVAEELHRLWWPHSKDPPLQINCALLEPSLAAAELFGATKGAFTDAKSDRDGVFGAAAKGDATIFLDEFAELPPLTQAKLLTAIEPSRAGSKRVHRFTPLGSTRQLEIDATKLRIVLATNRQIDPSASGETTLRDDLVARVSQLVVRIPSLKQTPAAIAATVVEALGDISRNAKTSPLGLSDIGALPALLDEVANPTRAWRFNHRDARRLAIEMSLAARASAKPRAMRGRIAVESEHVRAALARTNEPVSRRATLETNDPWTLPIGAVPSSAIATALEAMPLSDRYQALLLVRAWRECDGNAAAAWRRLVEQNAFAPGRGAKVTRNESSAFYQRWRALFGSRVRPA
ncbi:MAG: sigma 54-interacting transcriptional regulator [Myxococcales bacterium]|nr:sigma 54-interacting transcriptional regulator [Myxococcales bacterium]